MACLVRGSGLGLDSASRCMHRPSSGFHRSLLCAKIDEARVGLLMLLKVCRMRATTCGIDESEAAYDRSSPRPTCPSLKHHAVKRHRVFTLRSRMLAVVQH